MTEYLVHSGFAVALSFLPLFNLRPDNTVYVGNRMSCPFELTVRKIASGPHQ